MKPFLRAALAALALVAFGAAGIAMRVANRFEFTNCATGGSTAQTLPGGPYLMRVTDQDSRLCIADSAAADGGTVCGPDDGGLVGEMFPYGTVMVLTIPGASKSVSCRSAGDAGDVHFTYSP